MCVKLFFVTKADLSGDELLSTMSIIITPPLFKQSCVIQQEHLHEVVTLGKMTLKHAETCNRTVYLGLL